MSERIDNSRTKQPPGGERTADAKPARQQQQSPSRRFRQRFRSDVPAVWSLRVLAVIVILAVFTPLLPLQSPRLAITAESLSPPQFGPLFVDQEVHLNKQSAAVGDADGDALPNAGEADLEYGFETDEVDWFDGILFRARRALFGSWRLNSLCGRDLLGRDVLSRIFWGARVSLAVGFVAALVSLVLGVIYGGIAGYAGGWIDTLMMRLIDFLQSVPFIFIVIFLVTTLDARGGLLEQWGLSRVTLFFIVVGSVFWLTMARVVRGQVKSLRQEPFVEAARTAGARPARILFVHILPHTRGVVLAYLTLTIPRVMLFESFLSFLGLGISSPDVSWGLLMQEGVNVLTPIRVDWWLIVFPGVALTGTLFLLNVVGDGLRDAIDPLNSHVTKKA